MVLTCPATSSTRVTRDRSSSSAEPASRVRRLGTQLPETRRARRRKPHSPTRVANYNSWVSLAWLVTGETVGGVSLYPPANRLHRETALMLWTEARANNAFPGGGC